MYSCPHWLRPRNSPFPPAFGLIYEGGFGQQDRRHLFVTPWLSSSKERKNTKGWSCPKRVHASHYLTLAIGARFGVGAYTDNWIATVEQKPPLACVIHAMRPKLILWGLGTGTVTFCHSRTATGMLTVPVRILIQQQNQKWETNFLGNNAASDIEKAIFCTNIFVAEICLYYCLDPDPKPEPEPKLFKSRNRSHKAH